MKSSITFREERTPLLRAKLPFSLGCIPLSSGIAFGSTQDVALHLATAFPAGPSFKLALKPNDSSGNPFSLILKTGLAFWGSPDGAAFTLTAEFHFDGKARDPFFFLRVKPRMGDFSLRKDVNQLQTAWKKAPAPVNAKENSEQSHFPLSNGTSPHKVDNGTTSSPLSNGDAKSVKKGSLGFPEKEKSRSPSTDASNVVIGSNFSFKIEGLDRERKGRGDRKQKFEGGKEQDADSDPGLGGSGMIVHVPDEILQEQMKMERQKSGAAWSLGFDDSLRGCRILAHSSLPLGKQAVLNIRWGVKPPPELFDGWGSRLPSFSSSKLPFLFLDKISLESVVVPREKPKRDVSPIDNRGYIEHGMLPVSFVEENHELAQVVTMCYSMKRQLHLLYAENRLLKRAMEEMKSQVEFRERKGSWKPFASNSDLLLEEQSIPRSSLLDAQKASNGRENGCHDVEARKDRKDGARKDAHGESKKAKADHSISSPGVSDVSEELKKAIMTAKSSSAGGKND